MTCWLDPVRDAIDSAASPVAFFFRDDDAGWAHEKWRALTELFTSRDVAFDTAVIPGALTTEIARDLRRAAEARPRLIHLHQHGFMHANHEPNGRKAEFGPSRTIEAQRLDLAVGKRRLEDAVGPSAPAIFTPPWNRCTGATVECLCEIGFQILSRDRSAGLSGVPGIAERPVSLDWSGKHGVREGAAAWGRAIAGVVVSRLPVGLMLHHAVMTRDDFDLLATLLDLVAAHPNARLHTISSLSERCSPEERHEPSTFAGH